MLTTEEKRYLVWLTSACHEGWGAVIDLGAWLGSSSAALAEGLRRRGHPGPVHAFDRFIWEMEPAHMALAARERLEAGADFLPLFRREIGEYAPWIRPRRHDLLDYRWDEGPIEILFVDAAKSWELVNAILRGFGPHLVPGRSRVVLQDFRFHEAHWLPLVFDGRPDLWRQVDGVSEGTTVTFTPQKPLEGPGGDDAAYSEAAFPFPSVEHILRTRMARESDANAAQFLRSLYRAALIDADPDTVASIKRELVQAGIGAEETARLEELELILVPRGWQAFERGEYQAALELAERCIRARAPAPVYALALKGMSQLRLGQVAEARRSIAEVRARLPQSRMQCSTMPRSRWSSSGSRMPRRVCSPCSNATRRSRPPGRLRRRPPRCRLAVAQAGSIRANSPAPAPPPSPNWHAGSRIGGRSGILSPTRWRGPRSAIRSRPARALARLTTSRPRQTRRPSRSPRRHTRHCSPRAGKPTREVITRLPGASRRRSWPQGTATGMGHGPAGHVAAQDG